MARASWSIEWSPTTERAAHHQEQKLARGARAQLAALGEGAGRVVAPLILGLLDSWSAPGGALISMACVEGHRVLLVGALHVVHLLDDGLDQ